MPEENPRLAQWLEKFHRFMNESIAGLRPITVKARRIRDKKIKWYHFPTQVIRRDIVRDLGELYDLAVSFAKRGDLELKEREKWARLAAYIAQNINTIIDSYDEIKIEQTLDELKQYVKLHIEEG